MNKKTIYNRIIQVIISLLGISILTYGLIYLSPGDPIRTMYISSGSIPSEQVIEETRELLGLNKPFLEQYFNWITGVLTGDLGYSYSLSAPVSSLILPRLINSFYLAVISLVFMIVISLPLGIISAVKKDTFIDYIIRGYTFFGISSPNFFVGTLLLYFFALKLNFLPVVPFKINFEAMILPSLTLAIAMSAKYIRQLRTIVLDELSKDYVWGAKARGFKMKHIIFHDVLINILPPMVTLLALSFGSLLSGVAVVEVIFSYPGIGSLAVNAITAYDYNLIQAYVLIISVIYMIANLLVDIAYPYLDPRLKNGG